MLYETTLIEAQFQIPMLPLRAGWVMGKLVLAALLLIYLVGWAQDLKRVRRLEAQPAPAVKVITKYQAWERIYRDPARKVTWSNTLLDPNR